MSDKKISQLAAVTGAEITGAESLPLIQSGVTKQTTIDYIRDYVQSNINLGNPVNSFAVSGNNLTATLKDGTTFDVDITALTTDTNTQLSDADITALGYLKTDTNTQLTDADITSLGYIKSEHNTQLSDADIAAFGYVKNDQNTQLSDSDIAAFGYIKTDTNTQISDAEIAGLGYIKFDTNTQLTDAEITNLGYIKTYTDTQLTDAQITALGYIKTDANTQLSDADITALGYVKTDTQLTDAEIGALGYIKTDNDNNTQLSDADIAAFGYVKTDTQLTDAEITALGYVKTDNNTQLSDADIAAFGYVKTDNNTQLTDAEITALGYIKTDTNTQLSDAEIGALGYIKTDTNTQLTDAEITALGYVKTDNNTQLGDADIAAFGYVKTDTQLTDAEITALGYAKSSPNLSNTAMDFGLDSTGSTILLRDLSLGSDNVIESHAVNTLEAVASGTDIKIKVNDGAKVVATALSVSSTSINGSFVNSVLNQAVVQLNAIFTNTAGFASVDKFVNSFSLVGDNLTLGLNDGTSFTSDVTTFGVDENKFVSSATLNGNIITLTMNDATSLLIDAASLAIDNDTTITSGSVSGTTLNLTTSSGGVISIDASGLAGGVSVASGSVVGTDLVLVMSDASTVTIDAANMVNGASLSAVNNEWFISYGTNANNPVGETVMNSNVNLQMPFYFGQALTRGAEFKFNIDSGNQLRLGIWDGAAEATAYNGSPSAGDHTNWNTVFSYANGNGKFTSASNTDITTYHSSGYSITNDAPMSVRFGTDGHLTLMDLSGGTEVIVGKTLIPLSVQSFNMQVAGWNNTEFPNAIISDSEFIWEIVHDYAGTEAGLFNGALTHSVIKRNLALSPGEQYMIPLQKQGSGETFGIGYSGAATGIITAEDNLLTSFKYQTNESIIADVNWNHNTSSSNYFQAGGGVDSWRQGGAGTMQGLFSLRYLTDNTLQIWSETYNELVASSAVHPNGSDIYLYFGVNGNTSYVNLPNITKQFIGQGSQPLPSFQPIAANQTASIQEGAVLNFQVVTSDNIVNQFAEVDAPSWITLNQTTGILSGTAPSFAGTSADTIVVNCKAGNAIGGTIDFTVTVTITQVTGGNALQFPASNTAAFLTGNASNVSALQRAGNGTGSSDAWSISMWVKPSTDTSSQALFYYGGNNLTTKGVIQINQFSGGNVLFRFGDGTDFIAYFGLGNFTSGSWNHILVTYSGADTINANGGGAAFGFKINGVNGISQIQAGGAGYSGAILDEAFKVGSHNSANYLKGATVHQVAIWDSDQSANLATIYNSGATQDLSLLTPAPAHILQPTNSVTTISDSVGSADLTGFGFTAGALVTDAP